MFYSDVGYSKVFLTHTVTRKTIFFFSFFLQNLTKTIFIESLHVHKENPGWHQHIYHIV